MQEGAYKTHIIKELKKRFPDCVILKNDATYVQGIPDITILFHNQWAMLEVKISANAPRQPNQSYYIQKLDEMSFAAFIYPENEEKVLYELQRSFGTLRQARVS